MEFLAYSYNHRFPDADKNIKSKWLLF